MILSDAAWASSRGLAVTVAASDLRLATLPGFLEEEAARRIAADAAIRDDYEDVYGLVPEGVEGWIETRGRETSGEEYARAGTDDRYFRFQSTRSWSYQQGQRRLAVTAPFALGEMDCLLAYLRDATGQRLTKVRVWIRRFLNGHFVGMHHEDRLGRVISVQVPLSPGWSAGDGALLEIYDDDDQPHIVPPEFNQLVLFETVPCRKHAITPVQGGEFHLLQAWGYL